MASKKLVQDMLTHFCQIYPRTKMSDGLVKAYFHALETYLDEEIRPAAYKCLAECQYYPKPIEIIQRIEGHGISQSESDRDFVIVPRGSCEECGARDVRVIKEPKDNGVWTCVNCYSGLSRAQRVARWKGIVEVLEESLKTSNRLSSPVRMENLKTQLRELKQSWGS